MSESRVLSPAEVEQRGRANLRHGAGSEDHIRPLARVQKRRFLRQIGLRASDLDGVALAFLDSWARAQAKIELMDSWFARRGFLDEESGEPHGPARIYFLALNSARLSATRFAEYLKHQGARTQSLDDYIVEAYGGDEDGKP